MPGYLNSWSAICGLFCGASPGRLTGSFAAACAPRRPSFRKTRKSRDCARFSISGTPSATHSNPRPNTAGFCMAKQWAGGCGGQHSPAHCFAMQKPAVFGRGFECVAEGVPEIENLAQSRLFLVFRNDGRLGAHAAANDPVKRPGLAPQNNPQIALQEFK